MNKLFLTLSSVIVLISATSCTSQKKLTYFRNVTAETAAAINSDFKTAHEPTIVVGDMLVITVTGMDPEAVAPFNMPVISYSNPGSDQIYQTPSLQSYLVDTKGEIDFPILGKIKIAGLKKSDAIQIIGEKLQPFLKNAIVSIKFLNYKVTVMGEVIRPGQYTINNERVTILDAIGMAGDLTPYGKRNTVLVTREINGKLEFARINLNSDEVFTSPYYYLQQNDIIYVEPNSVRAISSQNLGLYLSTLTTIGSLTTVAITVLNSTRK